MKRVLADFLLIIMMVTLCACGNQEQDPQQTMEVLTWQEQYDLGIRYLSEGNYEEAIIAFTAAIEIDSKQAPAYVGRGNAYMLSGETEENLTAAQLDYEMAIEIDESNIDAYLGLADIYIRNERYEEGISLLEVALEKTQNSNLILEKLQELEEIVENLRKVYPDDYLYELYELDDSLMDVYTYYTDKLEFLYNMALDVGIDSVKSYLKENVGFFDYNGDSGWQISSFIETDFYYGTKIYFGETDELGWPNGYGAALCEDGFQVNIYLGEWEKGRRNGTGSYFNINLVGELTSYDGSWRDDKPNGTGVVLNETDPSREWEKHTGTFTNGYYDGTFEIEADTRDSHNLVTHAEFEMGKGVAVTPGTLSIVSYIDLHEGFISEIKPLTEADIYSEDGNWLISTACEVCLSEGIPESVELGHLGGRSQSSEFCYSVLNGFTD